MKIKSERGITGIDITVSILVITIFVSLIGVLIYNISAQSQSIERRTEAAYQAVNLIEQLKTNQMNMIKNDKKLCDITEKMYEFIKKNFKL